MVGPLKCPAVLCWFGFIQPEREAVKYYGSIYIDMIVYMKLFTASQSTEHRAQSTRRRHRKKKKEKKKKVL